jgi:hypothetical protein
VRNPVNKKNNAELVTSSLDMNDLNLHHHIIIILLFFLFRGLLFQALILLERIKSSKLGAHGCDS